MLGEATLDVSGTFAGEARRLLILFAAPQNVHATWHPLWISPVPVSSKAPPTLGPEQWSQVRTGLFAGGKQIRTQGPTPNASVPRAPHGSRHCVG